MVKNDAEIKKLKSIIYKIGVQRRQRLENLEMVPSRSEETSWYFFKKITKFSFYI